MKKYTLKTKMGTLFDEKDFFIVFEEVLPDVFYQDLIKMIGSPFFEQVREYTLEDAIVAMPSIFHIKKEEAMKIGERILMI